MPVLVLSVSGARGLVDDGLDDQVVDRLAAAFVATVGPGSMLIGRDSRPSGGRFARVAAAALARHGCAVEHLGIVPTPTVQVAVEHSSARGGLIVTASHNPIAWNALKFVGADGTFLGREAMGHLLAAYERGADAPPAAGESGPATRAAGDANAAAQERTPAGASAVAQHLERILADTPVERIRAAGVSVVVDAVHGAGAVLLEPLLAALGVEVGWIAGEPNGRLPEFPEPRAERLGPLQAEVRRRGAWLGFALDPDGDRCAVVTPETGLGEEWTLPLCALARLRRGERGPLVANWSTSSRIDWLGERFGVPIVRTPVGEAHVVAAMRAQAALIGGEGNGGVIDPCVHLGRDAGVAVARLLELETETVRGGVAAAAAQFPPRALHKAQLALDPRALDDLAAALAVEWTQAPRREDGLRWQWEDGWVHVRPSGTEPIVRLFAEAPSGDLAAERVARVEAVAARVRRAKLEEEEQDAQDR